MSTYCGLLQYNITEESPLWQQIALTVLLSALLIIYPVYILLYYHLIMLNISTLNLFC